MKKSLYGVPTLLVSDVVSNFMIEQGNSGQSHYADNLVRAARVWEDLTIDTIWRIKYKAVPVNKKDNSIKLPCDMLRFINLNVVDKCGMMVPLGFAPDMNTLRMDCPAKVCSCTSCNGEDSLCVALDAVSVVYETLMINGYPFQKRTWTQKGDGGVLQQVTEIPYPTLPYPSSGAPTVTYMTEYKTLCELEVTSNNCIKATESNRNKLVEHCGCSIPTWQREMCCSSRFYPSNDYGYWNYRANCTDIIELKDVTADMVIVAYQSSGDGGADEMIIPRIALDAMQYGIVHRQTAWNPSASRIDKKAAKAAYDEAKYDLSVFLHPVDLDAMDQLRFIIMKW